MIAGVETGHREMLGAAVIRAWIEEGPPRRLKIRVTSKADVDEPEMTVGVTADVDTACALVRDWLEGITKLPN
jgi:hypothetical protein